MRKLVRPLWMVSVGGAWAFSLFRMFWEPPLVSTLGFGEPPEAFGYWATGGTLGECITLGIMLPTVLVTLFLVTLFPAAAAWQRRLHYSGLGWLAVYACVWGVVNITGPGMEFLMAYRGWHVVLLPCVGAVVGLSLGHRLLRSPSRAAAD
jgi:uncharacterized membrane protein YhaH (DUF805 family)